MYSAVLLSPFNETVNVKVTIVSASFATTAPDVEITDSSDEAQDNVTSLPSTDVGSLIELTPFLIVPSITTELIALSNTASLDTVPAVNFSGLTNVNSVDDFLTEITSWEEGYKG